MHLLSLHNLTNRLARVVLASASIGASLPLLAGAAIAQEVPSFAGNAQHTAIYSPAAQDLNRIRWTTSIDNDNDGSFAHYGAPLMTAANTIVVPVKTASGFQIDTFEGSTGAAKYSLSTDYILPNHSWVPVYQPALANGPSGARLYYAGIGGTLYFIDNADSIAHSGPAQLVFYTNLANYQANAAAFNSTVFINTPLTVDAGGNVFFGFRVQGTAPAPLNTNQDGFARIDPNGNATYVLAGSAANDAAIMRDSHNSAPAVSNDGATIYVAVKSGSTESYGYLLGLDSVTLATKYKVFLKDPRNGQVNNATILDNGTASPTVAPDGDVYFGIYAGSTGSRGFLLRFSGDLTVEKTPGGFGWDYTAAIVPASMAPLYTGTSPYLIFAKYNNYPYGDGDGVNRIALLDPNATEIDPHTNANGLAIMREVLTVIGPTRDDEHSSIPRAVREWCINTAAVNPATNSIFVPSEDGHFYRWNLATNSLDQALVLSAGIGEPYVPTVIGPDGTVYTLNGGTMFAIGGLDGVKVTLTSSTPDIRTFLSGQTVTFTANVAAAPPAGFDPTGTVTFEDTIYFIGPSGLESSTSVLAIQSLDASGNAAFTTSSLSAAEHFIRAVYGGDTYFSLGSITLVQKAHGAAATTTLVSSPNPSAVGQAVSLTATVAAVPPESEIPTGMVTFQEGSTVLAQLALSGGAASFNTSSLGVGSHPITAVYASDSLFAASSGSVTHVTNSTTAPTATTVSSSTNPSVFGQSVTFTAVVTSGAGAPTGNVTFRDGGTTLGSVALDSTGRAVLSIASLTVGTHSITAQYAGSGAFNSSSSAPLSQTVNRAATRVTVTSSVDPAKVGQAVKFTAIVAVNAPGAGIPAGSVTFLDKGKTLATVTLDATGTATFTTSTLNQGAHQISVSYAGNAGFGTSVSPTLVQNIKK